jgi:flagellar biosynthesis/type III secretory pathway M-ring protein FliF/YscJ
VQAALSAGRLPALGGVPDALTAGADGQRVARDRMREELSTFVDNQPDEIAQLVQGWLAQQRKG